MLIDALKLRDLQKNSIKPGEDPFDSLLKLLSNSPRHHDFSVHALAVLRTRLVMMLLPKLPDNTSYNGRCKLIKRHLKDIGFRHGEDYDDDDIDEIISITSNVREAGENRKKASWSDLHHLDKKDLLESQNGRCQLCGRVLKLGSGSSSVAQPALDHVVPFDLGGNKNNTRLICRGCNNTKGQNLTFVNSDRVALNYFIKKPSSESEIRLWVMERDESRCTEPGCNNDSKTSELKVTVINSLGRYIFDNLRTVCESCYCTAK